MAGATIKGGDLPGLKKYLASLLADKAPGVKVGAMESATYPDGENVAQNLARHEFGAEVKREARKQTIYFKQNKDGTVKNRFVKKSKSNFSQEVDVGAHTYNIPARAPFRKTVEKRKAEWAKTFAEFFRKNQGRVEPALTELGEVMVFDIQQAFDDGLSPELATRTVEAKRRMGYGENAEKPVVLTGVAKQSITAEYTGNLDSEGGS